MVKKVILTVLSLFVLAVIVISVLITMQPDELIIVRSASFNAPPERVFEQVNDFHKWEAWSPWAKLDPAMKSFYSGPDRGTGSVYEWSGNDDVGRGKMTILESRPGEMVRIDLEFIEPMASRSKSDFTFKPADGKTDVTWSMTSEHDLISKAFCLVVDMDKLLRSDFEKGLAQLRPIVETAQ